jgi:hypothetical protein
MTFGVLQVSQNFGTQIEQAFKEHQNMMDIHVIAIQKNFCKVQTSSGEDG